MAIVKGRFSQAVLLCLLALWACDDSNRQESLFNPEIGHPENWVEDHGDAALTKGNTCTECHGTDLQGGVAKVSCFISQYKGIGCHERGEDQRHTTGWALPSEHGRVSKERPGVSSGLAFCQACHGGDYRGGTSQVACSSCHGVRAPHPRGPWVDGRYSHRNVHEGNADVCADCHRNAQASGSPGCFNLTLCHGEKEAHPTDWALAEMHGSAAKEDPGSGGFQTCQVCHGNGFAGGTSGVSCFTCHNLQAPHPRKGWEGGGTAHRSTGTKNAPVCAECHKKFSTPPDCFSANQCHPGTDDTDDTGDASEPGADGETDPPPEAPGGGGQ